MFDPGDVLLYAMSSSRQLNWVAFKRVFDQVYVRQARTTSGVASEDPDRHLRRTAMHVLEALGHCDSSFGVQAGEICIAPPVIATLPIAGLPRGVLCGSRSPETVGALRAAANERVRVTVERQAAAAFAPCRIEIQADSHLAMQQFAKAVGVPVEANPPAWSILAMSGSVDSYLSALNWSERPDLNWPRANFDVDALHFKVGSAASLGSSLTLARYENPAHGGYLFWLWDGASSAEVEPDWGRYAALWKSGRLALQYDAARASVQVPRTAPVPRLLARALALCSGYAPAAMPTDEPRRFGSVGADVYRDVAPDVYEMCAAKLGQSQLEFSP